MGQFALKKLDLSRQSFDLDVTHRGPLEPQYACVADGASAATGASLGKVNLRLEEAPVDGVVTVYTRKSTGQSVKLRPTEAFKRRFLDVPRPELARAGAQVLTLRDDEIFEEVK
jgi:formylmethanofuran dehydrogenase subunit E